MVTVYDVARASGLSIASVSRALNGQPGVSRATAARISQIADELGYQPNEVARSLVAKTTSTIALLLPDITNPFFPELVKGVQETADENENVLLLVDGAGDADRLAQIMRVLRRKQVDGVIVVASSFADSYDGIFDGMPAVFLDRETLSGAASVSVDHESGAYRATRHLIEHGHTVIAHIAGPRALSVSAQRLAGWRRACAEAGLSAGDDLVADGEFLESGGHRAGQQLLDSGRKFTAVFAANDMSAIGFLALCAQRSIRVPDDISVIGFDGIQLARYTTPALTTVAQPILKLGQLAGELLLELTRDSATRKTHLVLPTSLFTGESVRSVVTA
jgi:DNA-binding LacI/PurR family transcriptional regulator